MSTMMSANLAKEMVKEHSPGRPLAVPNAAYRAVADNPRSVSATTPALCFGWTAALTPQAHSLFWQTLPLVIAVKLIIFYHFGLLRGWWRYVGMSDVLNITSATFLSSALLFAMIVFVVAMKGYPRSVIPIDMVLSIMLVGGARFGVRAYTERAKRRREPEENSDRRSRPCGQRYRA